MKDIVLRIHQIIDFYQLSSASFADQVGVQRSSISHILSGRNKPSLDFILKTLNAFPTLSSEWLLHGKGEMDKTDTVPTTQEISSKPEAPDQITTEESPITSSSSNIDHVLILRSDGTFQQFKDQNSLDL